MDALARWFTLALLLPLATFATQAFAAPADYDARFAPTSDVPGFAVTNLRIGGRSTGLLPLADGRTLVASNLAVSGSNNVIPALLMLRADGSPDPTFGNDSTRPGLFSQDVVAGFDLQGFTRVLAVPGGGFIALGAAGGRLDFLKVTDAGQIDTRFGNQGLASITTTSFSNSAGGFDATPAFAIDTQGRLVVASTFTRTGVESNFTTSFAICRLLPSGALDTAYGAGGCATSVSNRNADAFSEVSGLVLDGDAAIFTGNATVNGQSGGFGAVRMSAAGQPDPAFGNNGIVRLQPVNNGFGAGLAVAMRPDRRLVFAFRPGSGAGSLLQLLPNGSLDTSFGGDGVISATGRDDDQDIASSTLPAVVSSIVDIALQADGKIVALARISTSNFTGPQLGRFLSNGRQDTGFGDVSVLLRGPDAAIPNNDPGALALTAEGGIVVAGSAGTNAGLNLYVAKLLGGASVRARVDEYVLEDQTDVGVNAAPFANPITISGLDSPVAITGLNAPALVRIENGTFTVNGASDGSGGDSTRAVYNGDVIQVRQNAAATPGTRTITRLIIGTGDDEVVETFVTTTAGQRACLPGDLDPAFAADDAFGPGIRSLPVSVVSTEDFKLLPLANGSLMASTLRRDNTGFFHELARYTASGAIDSGFNGGTARVLRQLDGRNITSEGNIASRHHDLLQLPDGKLMALITTTGSGGLQLALARYNEDGSLDTSFGRNGAVHLAQNRFGSTSGSMGFRDHTLLRLSDGRLLAAIGFSNGFNADENGMTLLRFNADGSLDASFASNDGDGTDGAAILRRNPTPQGPVIRLQGDRIVVMTFDGNQDFSFYRFNANGDADTNFGVLGRVQVDTANINLGSIVAQDFVVLPDQSLLFTTRPAALGKLTPDGVLDTTFASDGLLLRDGGRGFTELTTDLRMLQGQRLLRQGDGKLVVAGNAFQSNTTTLHFARFFANGTPDLGFGNDRVDIVPMRSTATTPPSFEILHRSFFIDSAQRLLFGGHFDGSEQHRPFFGRLCGGASEPTLVDEFSFAPRFDVEPDRTVVSNTITISGLRNGVPALVRVSGGEYSIGCNETFISAMEKVFEGDRLCVRHVAATEGTRTTKLSIGHGLDEFSADFVSDTESSASDAQPDAFRLADQGNVEPRAVVTSAAITPTGFVAPAPVTITGGEYSIGEAAFTAAAGQLTPGASIRVRHTAASGFDATTDTVLTIGGVSDTFTSTTRARDNTPLAFAFVDQTSVEPMATVTSAAVTITGIDDGAPISVSGGSYSLDCATNGFRTTASSIRNGQSVCVRHTAAMAFGAETTTTLTIGTESAAFKSRVRAARTDGAIAFSAASFSAEESARTVTISLIRTGSLESAARVTLRLADGSANAPADYDGAPITVNFAAGAGTASARVTIVDDDVAEESETVQLSLSDVSGAVLGTPASATLTILASDRPAGVLRLVAADYQGPGGYTVCALREQASAGVVEATLEAQTNSASNPVRLRWEDGDSTPQCGSFVGAIASDNSSSGARSVRLSKAGTSIATVAAPAQANFQAARDLPGFVFDQGHFLNLPRGTEAATIMVYRQGSTRAASVRVLSARAPTSSTIAAAVAGTDYERLDETLRWEEGDREPKPVSLRLLRNDGASGDRELMLTLADPLVEGTERVALIGTGSTNTALTHAVRVTLSAEGSAGPGESLTLEREGAPPVVFNTSAGRFMTAGQVESPANIPSDYSYPAGFFSFAIDSIVQGQSVTVTLSLPAGVNPTAYVKCTRSACGVFDGARIEGNVITLTLTDGGAGDSDGQANGVIRDPGAPAIADAVTPEPEPEPEPEKPSSGGGALSPAWFGFAAFALLLRRISRRKPAVTAMESTT